MQFDVKDVGDSYEIRFPIPNHQNGNLKDGFGCSVPKPMTVERFQQMVQGLSLIVAETDEIKHAV